MAITRVTDEQIKDEGVTRADLNVSTPGQAVITKVVAGPGVSISQTGIDDGTGDVTVSVTGTGVEFHNAGVVTPLTANMFSASGLNVTVPTLEVGFYTTPNFEGPVVIEIVAGTTLTCVDNAVNYVYASYNGGAPFFGVTTDVSIITESSVVPINTITAANGFLHFAHWDNVANGLPNKLHRRFVKTQRYAIQEGLQLSASEGFATITGGVVWRGIREFDLGQTYSDGTNSSFWYFVYKSAGSWVFDQPAPAFNYTQYQGPSDLVTMGSASRYTINWVFRGVEDHNHGYYVVGNLYTNYASAVADMNVPEIPANLRTHAVLVGRIICQYNNPVPVLVESIAQTATFSSVISNHNQLSNIQGGAVDEYYHETAAEHAFLQHIVAGGVGRDDVDVTTSGHAVITKVVAGNGVSLVSTGPDPGTGDVTINMETMGRTAGIVSPIITAANFTAAGLNVTVPTVTAAVYDNPDFSGDLHIVTVSGTTLTMSDNTNNFIHIDWNGGSPIYSNSTDIDHINYSDRIPVNTVITNNGFCHLSHWDNEANGLANKIEKKLVRTKMFDYESGLALTNETGVIHIAPGVVWRGARAFTLGDVYSDQRDSDRWFFVKKTAGVWSITPGSPAFNNTQYQGATDLVTLTDGYYTINWVFRGVEDHDHGYYMLGDKEYATLQAAMAENTMPAPPQYMSIHGIMVGRVIVQKNSTVTYIGSALTANFNATAINDHDSLGGLNGGTATERYHVTEAENTFLSHITTNLVGRDDVNTTAAGHAIIAKAVAGQGISLSSTGIDAGTGDVTIDYAGTYSFAELITAATQAIAQNVNTKVVFGTVRADLNTEWSAAANRFVAKSAGVFQVNSIITTTATFNNSIYYMSIYKNGAEYVRGIQHQSYNGWSVMVNGLIPLAVNDFIEIYVRFGASRTIAAGLGSHLSIAKV